MSTSEVNEVQDPWGQRSFSEKFIVYMEKGYRVMENFNVHYGLKGQI